MAEQDTAEDTGTEDVETEEADDAESAEGEETEGAEAEEQDAWTPPSKDEWEKQQAKLKRANEQAKKLREAATASTAKKTVPAPRPAPRPAAPAAEAEPQPGIDPAELTKWQTRAVRGEARKALEDRGADRDLVALVLNQLKVDEIDFDDNDAPMLDYWLDEMEDKYPKLFAQAEAAPAPAPRPRPGRVDQGAAAGAKVARPPMGLGEQIIAASKRHARQAGA